MIVKFIVAAIRSSHASRTPVAAQARMFLAIAVRLPAVRRLGGKDSTAESRTSPNSESSSGQYAALSSGNICVVLP
jgi:hypothetical protein